MNRLSLLFALIGASACASHPAGPSVTITQLSQVAAFRVDIQSGLPVEYRLDVTNPFDHPVTLTLVELETVGGSGAYAMKRVRHKFAETIPAHGGTAIELRAWVQPLQATDSGQIVSAVMLRGTARFESEGSTIQSAFTGRLAQ